MKELYRTYEVLVEETVSPDDPRRGKTNKENRYSAEITTALRDTNDIFQDAVCYYTLLLAGLVGDGNEGAALNPLWRHLRGKSMRAQTDTVVKRLASRYPALAGLQTAEEFLERARLKPGPIVSAHEERETFIKLCALFQKCYSLLEEKATERDENGLPEKCTDLTQLASSFFRRFCDPNTTQADSTQETRNENYFAALKEKLQRATSREDPALADGLNLKHCFMTPLRETEGEDALADYLAAFRLHSHKQPTTVGVRENAGTLEDSDMEEARKRLAREWGAKPTKQTSEPMAEYKKRLAAWSEKAKTFPLRSFAGKKPNKRLWFCLRYRWSRDTATRMALLDLIEDSKLRSVSEDERDAISEVRALLGGRNLFPYFTAIVGERTSTMYPIFDVSAFAAAAEDVFKYKIRTLDREKRYTKLDRERQAFEGSGIQTVHKEASRSNKEIQIRGMGDDPRLPVMKRLLQSLADKFEFDEYGLRPGTIGGWADLRKAFRQCERQAERHDWTQAALVEALEGEVEKAQRNNPEGFGSAAFFDKLCEPQYHCLWLAKPRFTGVEGQVRDEHVKDFVRHYVRYSSLLEDVRALEEGDEESGEVRRAPIRFTWPGTKNRHGEISYRHFDFKAQLNRSLPLTLLRRLPDADGQPVRYELREDYLVTLAARRLKRDRVMTSAGNTVDAVWCPPLVLAETPPKVGKRSKNKKQGKDQDISFSLMVSAPDKNGLTPPVYLKVAVPITFTELKKLKQASIAWEQGSLRGHRDGDEKRSYFRWPTDLKIEALAKKESDAAGMGQSKKNDETVLAKLWCGDGTRRLDSFRVKDGKVDDFHVLSIDLNVRFAAAFARLRVFINDGTLPPAELAKTRRLSSDDFATDIRAHAHRRGTMRLPGEDATVWQKTAGGVFEFSQEPFGSKGRSPSLEERSAFTALAGAMVPTASFPLRNVEGMSFPELGDVLVRRLRRRLSRIKFLFKLRWQVSGRMERNPDTYKYDLARSPERQAAHRRTVVELLGKLAFPKQPRPDEAEHPDNRRLRDALNSDEQAWESIHGDIGGKKGEAEEAVRQRLDTVITGWDWTALFKETQAQLDAMFGSMDSAKSTAEMLAEVVNHCLPLRGRVWRWWNHELGMTAKPEHKPLIRGMRGLSIRRIEQISDLRQCCQSFAKLEKRYRQRDIGIEPSPTLRGDIVDDPCPELLVKRNELREQRVNQTAHMILAEALGLKLKNPAEVRIGELNKKQLKSERDLHGQYEPMLDATGKPLFRCGVIVMEDLSRYRTSQDRSRGKNRQLMNWCHRAVVEKLQDIAKPFGITLMLVDAAYSSRFHSLSGLPGVRVEELSRQKLQEMPFAAWADEKNKAKGGKPPTPTDRAKGVQELRELFEANQGFSGTLLMPVEGGKQFIAVSGADGVSNGLENADENAAINIGLRALAHPDRFDVFHRIQTEAENESALRVRNRRGWFAELDANDSARIARCQTLVSEPNSPKAEEDDDEAEDDIIESASRPNLFFVPSACLPLKPEVCYRNSRFEAARYGPYWGQTKYLAECRIRGINNTRLNR